MAGDAIMNVDMRKRIFSYVLFGVCLIGLIICTYHIIFKMTEEKKIKEEYHDLSKLLYEEGVKNECKSQTNIPPVKEDKKKLNLKCILKKNHDFVGWLTIEDTKISYPVVQNRKNNNFYLTHDFYKRKERHGVPFLDKNCDADNGQSSLLIYGHHMKDGTMFAELMNYIKKGYYDKHKIITFTTLKRRSYYEVCSVCLVNAQKDKELFQWLSSEHTNDEFATYKKRIMDMQLYSCEEELGDQQLLTLVTCEYSKKNNRLLVVAKKVKRKKIIESKKG